jgi:hypothetical protein
LYTAIAKMADRRWAKGRDIKALEAALLDLRKATQKSGIVSPPTIFTIGIRQTEFDSLMIYVVAPVFLQDGRASIELVTVKLHTNGQLVFMGLRETSVVPRIISMLIGVLERIGVRLVRDAAGNPHAVVYGVVNIQATFAVAPPGYGVHTARLATVLHTDADPLDLSVTAMPLTTSVGGIAEKRGKHIPPWFVGYSVNGSKFKGVQLYVNPSLVAHAGGTGTELTAASPTAVSTLPDSSSKWTVDQVDGDERGDGGGDVHASVAAVLRIRQDRRHRRRVRSRSARQSKTVVYDAADAQPNNPRHEIWGKVFPQMVVMLAVANDESAVAFRNCIVPYLAQFWVPLAAIQKPKSTRGRGRPRKKPRTEEEGAASASASAAASASATAPVI